MTLSKRQGELLEKVCLKKWEVQADDYMGWFQPHQSVRVINRMPQCQQDRVEDVSFRISTVSKLVSLGLAIHTRKDGARTYTVIKPTKAGLEAFNEMKGRRVTV